MVKGRIHEESGKSFCFVEVELEADTPEAFITSYIEFLGKLRQAHDDMVENGFTGQKTASKKQIDLIKRLAKEQNKELSSITEYVAKRFRKPTIQQITKEEATSVIDLMMPKKDVGE